MKDKMIKLTCKPYVKYMVIKIDMFQSELVDEMNFDPNDEFAIATFKRKYKDDCYQIVIVDM